MSHTTTKKEVFLTEIAQLMDMAENHPEVKKSVIEPFINHIRAKVISPYGCRVRNHQQPAA